MIAKLSESSDSVIGFKVSGTVKKDDYQVLIPEVEAAVQNNKSANLLLDLTELEGEALEAWGSDMKFGREYRKKINKMAIVGDKRWQQWMTKLAEPFFAKKARYFESSRANEAWVWLRA